MDYKNVEPNPFKKKLSVPGSKSYANRFLILAALEEEESTVAGVSSSSDVQNLVDCLLSIGLVIERRGDHITIANSFPTCERQGGGDIHLKTGDGGTTNRFLAALLALGSKRYILKSSGCMKARPMDELLCALGELGVEVEKKRGCIAIRGPVRRRREVRVDCHRSSQFASALLLALSKSGIQVKADNLRTSLPYWKLSGYALKLKDQSLLKVPHDFSSMSYPLALAATDGAVSVRNYTGRDPYQGDSAIVDILGDMGALIREDEDNLWVEKSRLESIEYGCANCLDIVPVLAYLCSYAKGKSLLRNIGALRYKESDRIAETIKLLQLFGVDHRLVGDDLEIQGPTKRIAQSIDVWPATDHRMIMTSYLYLHHNGGGRIYNYRHVDKSFPNFFEAMS